jgi:hypothetical protein
MSGASEAEAAVEGLVRDMLSTLPWTRERVDRMVQFEARVVGEVDHERGTFAWWLVEHIQADIHHEGESTWPTCPQHRSHPLWLRYEDHPDFWWVCRSDDIPIAQLGRLPSERPGVASHDSPPQLGDGQPDVLEAAMASMGSPYSIRIRALGDELRNKVVAGSVGGHSGYALRFTDGSWVAVWLDPGESRMDFATGLGELTEETLARLSDPAVPDASHDDAVKELRAFEVRHVGRVLEYG